MGSNKVKFKKVPKTNKSKGKRWKKGHSSTSNPENKSFREAARNRYFQKNEGPSSLTMDALAIHDKSQDDAGFMATESDRQTIGTMGTFKTWATNWTECTNTTFSKVHRYWASNSAQHKEILAVLAAVTEVIKTQGGKETETEYFAALMTALESSEGEESMSAIVYLVSLAIKRVPVAVLRSKFSPVAKCFLELLVRYSDSDQSSLLKSLITCLSFLLRAQEAAVWSNTSTLHIYKGLLTFITHKKPKVRKMAQTGVCIVLKGSLFMLQEGGPSHHPAASTTAKYCIQLIESCGGSGEATDSLHTLALLRSILPVLSPNSVKSVCETILRLMTLSDPLVTASGMQALHGLFSAKPKSTTLPPDLNAQIITAMYDYQPSENDVQPTLAWLTVMESAHVNLASLDKKLCLSFLPKIFSTGMLCLLSQQTEIINATTKVLKSLIHGCVACTDVDLTTTAGASSPIQKIVKALETGLSYQFHASWGHVMQLYSAIFQVLGKPCPDLFQKTLSSLADLRDSARFAYKAELDHAVGSAVKAMGPRHVLTAIPLQITGQSDDLDFPRSWLLPVMHKNVMDTELAFFTEYFLPLAAKLRQRGLELQDQQNVVASKTYETLQFQIWSLLPGFCTRPTDLVTSFRGVAKVLGTAIAEREDLRMEVMSSLRKLVGQSLNNDKAKAELSRFSKNFMPILFNLFITDTAGKEKDPSRLAVFETIKCYFQITDATSVISFCEKCREKLNEEGITSNKKYALLDLLMAMLPYLVKTHIQLVFQVALIHIQDPDKSMQKKCYRILEELCAGKSLACRDFVTDNIKAIQEALAESLSSASPSAKAPRLRCLINIFKQLETPQDEFLLAVLPEAILCTKEVAERARSASYGLLVEMGHAVIRWGDETSHDVLDEYFKMLMAGFAGSPQMVSGTLLALTRVMYQFKDQISSALLESILENTCLLLKSKSREIVQSALAFTKVLLSAYDVAVLAQHLKFLVTSLVSMKQDCHHHFRFKSKEIYTKLIRKFGYETIYGMVPEGVKKVLANIRKQTEREKKKKKEHENDESEEEQEHFTRQTENINELLEDSDSEMETDDLNKNKGKKSKSADKSGRVQDKSGRGQDKKGRAWLQEGEEDGDIMDFMDKTASKKVMATKPLDKKTKKVDSGFKTAPDGRLIITESSDEEGGAGSDDEDIDDLLEALEKGRKTGKIKQQKKRKIDDLGNSDDEGQSPSKYKAGGHGIHRPLGKNQKPQKVPTEYGKEYKAKKAKGDVKKKDQPDPYAYVPLDFRNLNKRKQAKVKGQFTNLVKGAKKGALKGSKGKKKK